jgi:hypothetical protein
MPSRIRFLADKFEFQLPGDDDAGAAVFEQRLVNGVPGLALKVGRIGNLTVNTIHLKNESVTVPVFSQLTSDFVTDPHIGSSPGVELTIFEQNIVTKAVQGSLIFVEALSQITGDVIAFDTNPSLGGISIRVLVNNAQVLAAFPIKSKGSSGSPNVDSNPQRVFMTSLVATGATQTINIKWNGLFSFTLAGHNGQFKINAGSRAFAVAMKR